MTRKTLILGCIAAATGGLGLFSIFLITAISGVGVYGVFAMALAITILVSNLLKLGLDAHIMKHCPPVVENHGAQTARQYLLANVSVVTWSMLTGLFFSQALAAFFIAPALSVVALVVSVAALALLLKIVVATLLRALGAVLISQYFLRLGDILVFVVLILLVWVANGLAALTIWQLTMLWAVAVSINLLLALVIFVHLTRGYAAKVDAAQFKAEFSELFYFSAINAVATVLQTLDVLLIGYLSGDTNVGIYSILKRSVNQIYVVVGLFQIQYWGQLSVASAKSDTATIHRILRRARRAVSLSLPPLCLLATGLAYVLLNQAGVVPTVEMGASFAVLMVGMVVNSLFLFAATLANLAGLERLLFLALVGCGVVYFSLLFLGDGNILIVSIAFLLYQIGVNTTLAIQLYRRRSIRLFATN